jgi:hypothetical protein
MSCHDFLKENLRYLIGLDASGNVTENMENVAIVNGVNVGEGIANVTLERPPLGVKAAKKARLQQELITKATATLHTNSQGRTSSSNPDFARIGISLQKMAENTTGMLQLYNMQSLVQNNSLDSNLRCAIEAELLQHQLEMFSAQQEARSKRTEVVGDKSSGLGSDIESSDNDNEMDVDVSHLHAAIEVASEISTENANVNESNNVTESLRFKRV